jgi:hypothetical protein
VRSLKSRWAYPWKDERFLRLSRASWRRPAACSLRVWRPRASAQTARARKILIEGRKLRHAALVRCVAPALRGQEAARFCLFLPTASADGQTGIIAWFRTRAADGSRWCRRASLPAASRRSPGRRSSPLSTASLRLAGIR